jgi:hypothetical protein
MCPAVPAQSAEITANGREVNPWFKANKLESSAVQGNEGRELAVGIGGISLRGAIGLELGRTFPLAHATFPHKVRGTAYSFTGDYYRRSALRPSFQNKYTFPSIDLMFFLHRA